MPNTVLSIVQRAGHVVLDGVVDSTAWVSYGVTLDIGLVGNICLHFLLDFENHTHGHRKDVLWPH